MSYLIVNSLIVIVRFKFADIWFEVVNIELEYLM